jgi:hypothetical protein
VTSEFRAPIWVGHKRRTNRPGPSEQFANKGLADAERKKLAQDNPLIVPANELSRPI